MVCVCVLWLEAARKPRMGMPDLLKKLGVPSTKRTLVSHAEPICC
jgi:hypothetical protein